MHEGKNALMSILADGWYSGYIGYALERDHYGNEAPRSARSCDLEHPDGSHTIVGTDSGWSAATGPTLMRRLPDGRGL